MTKFDNFVTIQNETERTRKNLEHKIQIKELQWPPEKVINLVVEKVLLSAYICLRYSKNHT